MDNVEPFEHVKASLSNVAESLEMYSQETHVIDLGMLSPKREVSIKSLTSWLREPMDDGAESL